MRQIVASIASAAALMALLFGASGDARGQERVEAAAPLVQPQAHGRARGLGKFSEWSEPVNLGPVVNSAFNDWFSGISPDGLSLYISSNRPGGFGGLDIWVSQRAARDAPWGAPLNLGSTINDTSNEFLPNFSPDGHWMFFTRNPRPLEPGCGLTDLWVSWREKRADDFGWGQPTKLGCTINSSVQDNGPNFFEGKNGVITTVYFTSLRPGGAGSWDIYASTRRRDGSFGSAALVWELSSPDTDLRTAIRRDGLEMIMSSDRPGGLGNFDLWASTRETTRDAWSGPVNLGTIVNSEAEDGDPVMSPDARTLYFNSDRPGGFGGRDLYVTTRDRLRRPASE